MREPLLPGPAWLFCPADRPDRYPKALAAADVVILDLEDAVAPDKKGMARDALRGLVEDRAFDRDRTVVRINAADSAEHVADLQLIDALSLPRVMLAKSENADDIRALSCDVVALVETARGVEHAGALAEPDNTIAMMWGADDLLASMGGTGSRFPDGSYRDVARFARVRVLTAAKAAGLLALDAVHMDIPDTAGLQSECADAVASGFDGTVAIHPGQVAVIRSTYAPTDEQIDWATRLFAHVGDDRGVATFEGRMVDGPIYKQAERVLRLAELTRAPTKESRR
ncbi:MAG TPA: CoA ester lyase [Flexivirga sp.]|uniref:HpcH/HpaI aldolase/citrate lyase family protein n=1 Tax=Flexivirga sp. TaxID=1962927 RepID=UPI002BF21FC5|nr:CoA ester lyase [Flexivirga sp.]HWC21709.1 CoA ester lyase [Flexivirga sp.]